MSPIAASSRRLAPIPAAVWLNFCRSNFSPPANMETPSTSKMLPRIEPVERGFDNIVKPRAQSHKRNNQFRGTAQRSIEQCADAGTDMGRQMLCGSP